MAAAGHDAAATFTLRLAAGVLVTETR